MLVDSVQVITGRGRGDMQHLVWFTSGLIKTHVTLYLTWTHLQRLTNPLQGRGLDWRQQAGQRRHPGGQFTTLGAGLLEEREQRSDGYHQAPKPHVKTGHRTNNQQAKGCDLTTKGF